LSAAFSGKVYSRHFWMLCCSSLLFFASFNMLIPELPKYLTSLGGAEYKGLIISLFTLTAMLSRPFSGKLADKIGRVPIILTGSAVCFVCSLIYPVLSSVGGFFLLRLVHGFSTGFTPTGQASYLADIIPSERRGEAMGFLGTAGSLGMAGGPALGGLLGNHFTIDAVFYCSSALALVSIIIVINIRETLTEKRRFHPSLLKVNRGDVFEPNVLTPCLVMVLCSYAYGAVLTVMPDFGAYVGIRNQGLLFAYLTVASLLIRLIGGKASDFYGRRPVLIISSFVMVVSMLVVAFSETRLQLIIGVAMYGFAQGATSPTLLAWAADLSDINYKGRGLASLYIFMEFGIGVGALASGIIYGNDAGNFFLTFSVCATLATLAFTYLIFIRQPYKFLR
jgi:MFS family permease